MTTIFKSPVNKKLDAATASAMAGAHAVLFGESVVAIEPNMSANVALEFDASRAPAGAPAPFVTYNIVCPDGEFALAHYISSIDQHGFSVNIENQATIARKLRIIYKAEY